MSREQNSSPPSIIIRLRRLLSLPAQIAQLNTELHQLNENLATLPEIRDEAKNLTVILADMRTMSARLLGWRVVKKE